MSKKGVIDKVEEVDRPCKHMQALLNKAKGLGVCPANGQVAWLMCKKERIAYVWTEQN